MYNGVTLNQTLTSCSLYFCSRRLWFKDYEEKAKRKKVLMVDYLEKKHLKNEVKPMARI